MIKIVIPLITLGLGLTACGVAAAPVVPTEAAATPIPATATLEPSPTPAGPYDYDASLPFDEKILSETEQEGVMVMELTYAAHDAAFAQTLGGRTSAYLVKPKGAAGGASAGVLFVHWLGGHNGNKKEFLEEAITLAQRGVVSLLIQGQVPWMKQFVFDERDVRGVQQQVVEMRRALDFLQAQPEVDKTRLAVVGHDYGGMYAGILSGVDPRAVTYVIVAATPKFGDWAGAYSQNEAEVNTLMATVQPVDFVSQAQGASFLFQFGEQDGFALPENTRSFFEAAVGEKDLRLYPSGHAMALPEILQDRMDWLKQELEIQP